REYGDRQLMTDAEFAARRATVQKQTDSDNADFDLETADRSNAGAVGSATSPPPHWLERGKASRRTSMVIAPEDGRVPAMTDEGRRRLQQRRPVQRARGSEPVGALHHARRAERYLPHRLQRQPAHRAGAAGSGQ